MKKHDHKELVWQWSIKTARMLDSIERVAGIISSRREETALALLRERRWLSF